MADEGSRAKKRARLENGHDTLNKHTTQLFAPFRALGLISTGVPFSVQLQTARGSSKAEFSYVTCTGKSWALWSGQSILLRFVGSPAVDGQDDISSVELNGNHVWAAAGDSVYQYLRGKRIAKLSVPTTSKKSKISKVLILGDKVMALDAAGEEIWIWDIESKELYTTITFPQGFTANGIIHPATYLNKVLVSSKEGALALWNVQTCTLIHTYEPAIPGATVTSLAQSPAVDVVAVGYSTGDVQVVDIRLGETLIKVKMDLDKKPTATEYQQGITSIAFRTDNLAHTLATASSDGSVALWDLDTGPDDDLVPGRLIHTIKQAHTSPVGSVQFLSGQPVMVTSGSDNALRQWLFESPTTPPRILRERSGHQAPPTFIRHYGTDGKALLTAGGEGDRALRYTSVVRDSRSFELSGKRSNKTGVVRYPPVKDLAFSTARSRDWDDLLTVHEGEGTARSWSVSNKRKGDFNFAAMDKSQKKSGQGQNALDKSVEAGNATAVCISACGNFALVGFANSPNIGVWNMQSGIRRRTFSLPGLSPRSRDSHISGIALDALNKTLVVSTLAGSLFFFDFHTTKLIQQAHKLPAGINSLLLNRDNNLLATTCDDMVIRIIDIETRRTVRELSAFRGRILDVAFSADSRWLIVSSSDSVVRTFDLPTGRLIDAFRTPSVAISLSFSPTGDFLATAHVESMGVFLWANRAQLTEVSHKTFSQEDEIPDLALPTIQGQEDEDEAISDLEEESVAFAVPSKQDQLADGLISLSIAPRTKWQTLLNLDTIRARNKPKEAPKAPSNAPFFLPSLPGTEPRFDFSQSADDKEGKNDSRIGFSSLSVESEIVQALQSEANSGDYSVFFEKLLALPPASLDLELRSLTVDHLAPFIDALTARLRSHKDFEAIQSVLAVFLRVQGEALLDDTQAIEALRILSVEQDRESERISKLVGFCLGSLSFIRNAPVV